MPTRNEVIGTTIGKALGYSFQSFVYVTVVQAVTPKTFVLLKCGSKYGIKLINYTCNNYHRVDFASEIIFSEAIEASFFAY